MQIRTGDAPRYRVMSGRRMPVPCGELRENGPRPAGRRRGAPDTFQSVPKSQRINGFKCVYDAPPSRGVGISEPGGDSAEVAGGIPYRSHFGAPMLRKLYLAFEDWRPHSAGLPGTDTTGQSPRSTCHAAAELPAPNTRVIHTQPVRCRRRARSLSVSAKAPRPTHPWRPTGQHVDQRRESHDRDRSASASWIAGHQPRRPGAPLDHVLARRPTFGSDDRATAAIASMRLTGEALVSGERRTTSLAA